MIKEGEEGDEAEELDRRQRPTPEDVTVIVTDIDRAPRLAVLSTFADGIWDGTHMQFS